MQTKLLVPALYCHMSLTSCLCSFFGQWLSIRNHWRLLCSLSECRFLTYVKLTPVAKVFAWFEECTFKSLTCKFLPYTRHSKGQLGLCMCTEFRLFLGTRNLCVAAVVWELMVTVAPYVLHRNWTQTWFCVCLSCRTGSLFPETILACANMSSA